MDHAHACTQALVRLALLSPQLTRTTLLCRRCRTPLCAGTHLQMLTHVPLLEDVPGKVWMHACAHTVNRHGVLVSAHMRAKSEHRTYTQAKLEHWRELITPFTVPLPALNQQGASMMQSCGAMTQS